MVSCKHSTTGSSCDWRSPGVCVWLCGNDIWLEVPESVCLTVWERHVTGGHWVCMCDCGERHVTRSPGLHVWLCGNDTWLEVPGSVCVTVTVREWHVTGGPQVCMCDCAEMTRDWRSPGLCVWLWLCRNNIWLEVPGSVCVTVTVREQHVTGGPWVCVFDCAGMTCDSRSPGLLICGLEMAIGLWLPLCPRVKPMWKKVN